MALSRSRQQIIATLAEQLRQFECAGKPRENPLLSSGVDALDALLPEKGFRFGALIEWLSEGNSSGATTLALLAAREATRKQGAFVVLDGQREFYPPATVALGINPETMLIVRPEKSRDEAWAMEQILRSPAVGAVLTWMNRLEGRMYRRFQLAAEAGQGLGLLVRPSIFLQEPSWADVRLLVQPLPSQGQRRLRVELIRCRQGNAGKAVELEIDEETGLVHLATKLAPPATLRRSTGA